MHKPPEVSSTGAGCAGGSTAEEDSGDSRATKVDPEEFRRAVGRFATGITIVSTVADGADHAMTVNAFTSVSLDPVLVLFCVEKIARFHEVVISTGEWAVSVLGAGGREASQWFATRGRPL